MSKPGRFSALLLCACSVIGVAVLLGCAIYWVVEQPQWTSAQALRHQAGLYLLGTVLILFSIFKK